MSVDFDFSLRYVVVGVYKDRSLNTRKNKCSIWRIYPVPFFRISITRSVVGK